MACTDVCDEIADVGVRVERQRWEAAVRRRADGTTPMHMTPGRSRVIGYNLDGVGSASRPKGRCDM